MVIAGTWKPWMLTPSFGSSSLTSGATFSWISPLSSTIGVTFSFTPNCWNWMAVTPMLAAGDRTAGTRRRRGSSASWPDMAIRLGRARVADRALLLQRLQVGVDVPGAELVVDADGGLRRAAAGQAPSRWRR